MAEPTPKQRAEIDRLVAEGVPESQAEAIATDPQLDYPVKYGSGTSNDPRIPRLADQ